MSYKHTNILEFHFLFASNDATLIQMIQKHKHILLVKVNFKR